MGRHKSYTFNPDGNDLKRVFYYYGIPIDEKIICPFHDDHSPSCHVNFDDGIFHCFACGASGDAFKFVRLANPKINDLKSLLLYHAILNSKKVSKLKLSAQSRKSKDKKQKEKESQEDYDIAYDFYHGLKTIDWAEDDSTYKRYMINRGFTEKALNDCGAKLTYTSENYPIIFPMFDNKRFKGFVCRTTSKKVEQKRKYLYNKGFSRRDTLAGDYEGPVVVLVEGYMDMLKMKQFGLKNVAAILGWKITSIQIEKLKAMGVKTIISALDVDKPGVKGTEYLQNYFDVIRFQFPKGVKDPGDLNKEQFKIAYRKTKRLYRRKQNEHSK